jgi:hypothetical protein
VVTNGGYIVAAKYPWHNYYTAVAGTASLDEIWFMQ